MLAVSDLINIKQVPAEENISLKLMLDFYEKYLCKRVYKFTLDNEQEVKIAFQDASEIYHLSGIQHIYKNRYMDASRFVQEVRDSHIEISDLKKVNHRAYNDYSERIRSFFCIDAVLKNCEYLWFEENQIKDTKISVKYLLLKSIETYSIHLGIDTYNQGRIYYPKTLLVTRGTGQTKFLDRASGKLRVIKLEIIMKETDDSEEVIDRRGAREIVERDLWITIENWLKDDFRELFEKYIFTEEIKEILVKEFQENDTWLELKESIHRNINREKRDEWIAFLKTSVKSKEQDFKNEIRDLDPYWTGKIVSEAMRSISSSQWKGYITGAIDLYVKDRFDKIKTYLKLN